MCCCISVNTGIEGCDAFDGFNWLPIAAPRALWEARTRAEWEAEYSAYTAMRETGMYTLGMLIDAHKRSDDPAQSILLDYWNGRNDTLGQLLNLAATML